MSGQTINPATFLAPSKSYMMSDNDFLFSDKFEMASFDGYNPNSEVLSLVLNEFQPEKAVFPTALLGDLAASVASRSI